ncbi:MAG: hypothetical protein AAF368_05725, partial [Planctomycetota bacterium]
MEAVGGESSFSRNTREQDEGRYNGGNLLLWIAVIAVLLGLNFASWSFCMWVFGQPEHPMNYNLLMRLEMLDPLRSFTPFSAPRGKFYSAKDIYAQTYPFSETELKAFNGIQKRHYIKNYIERASVSYLSGEFTVVSVQRLGPDDVFPEGYVVRGRSISFPDALLDLALPSHDPPEQFALRTGQIIQIEESAMCAALLHVERRQDATMIFTAVPLVTKESPTAKEAKVYEFGQGVSIPVFAPPRIRVEPSRWPISSDEAEVIEPKPVELLESTESPEAQDATESAEVEQTSEA